MENNINILETKVPERLSNIVKGILLIILSLPFTIFIFIMIAVSGFRGDVQGPDHGWLAAFISGVIFIVFLVIAIRLMIRPVSKTIKNTPNKI
jgi:membrane protein implicated in regulation of membrane protease activity